MTRDYHDPSNAPHPRRRRTDKPAAFRDPELPPQAAEALAILVDACRAQHRLQRDRAETKKKQARAHLRLVVDKRQTA